ncbi:hypothetical protein LSTR_LSTR011275 [Laodelphax striatellus]|uniref:Protein vestigial n=1 Tax=Laodelphax striatellus TaxID=195883 RepID=A0A482XK86_LAOST|nr:hypothetical protein LSTR_LSTR011275 [Laodelphax striatellus]
MLRLTSLLIISSTILCATQCEAISNEVMKTFRSQLINSTQKCTEKYNVAAIEVFNMIGQDILPPREAAKCYFLCMMQEFNLMDNKGQFDEVKLESVLNFFPKHSKYTETIETRLDTCLAAAKNASIDFNVREAGACRVFASVLKIDKSAESAKLFPYKEMSCSEVVYQAYYPYLYQRPSTSAASAAAQSRAAAAAHFPAFPHNYDRFNVAAYGGSSLVGGGSGGGGGGSGAGGGSGSVSSGGGAGSPGSPGLHHKDEESTPPETTGDEEALSPGDAVSSRAQYVSANCVVFTHYTGDVASVVDEHFTRALSYKTPSSPNSAKESSPMTSRNFPPSFWNSNYQSTNQSSAADLYGDSVYHHNVAGASTDPWHHPHYQYSHHRAVHEYHHHHHHHNMAAQYGSLLLGHPPPARLGHPGHHATGPYHHHAATKPPEWPPNHRPQQPHAHLDPPSTSAYPPAAYPSMSGLEAQVQADSKDLYWF